MGRNIVLMVDDVLIYIEGHKIFKINLALSLDTIEELVKQVKMLVLNNPPSTDLLK